MFVDISLDMFRQLWSDTGCGWIEPGQMAGQAMTYDYTTVVTINKTNQIAYVVFFGEKGAYVVRDPKPGFFEDLKNRRMLGKYEALHTDRYSDVHEV